MPLLTTRRALWLPGVAMGAAALGIAALVGLSLGARGFVVSVSLVAVLLVGVGAIERLRVRRRPAPPRTRGRLKVIHGGKDYDLAEDDRTESQRYLM